LLQEGKEHFMNKRQIMKPAERAGGAGCSAVWRAVGRRLALRRTELGYRADRVADEVGIAAGDYRDYENGAPIPAFLLGEIANLLGRSVTWFFEGVDHQEAPDSEGEAGREPVTYQVATVEHRIQALTESFRKLDFEGQQHLLALSRALCRANAE
jgi:transcriptional regulator with XRE-family HTH domain